MLCYFAPPKSYPNQYIVELLAHEIQTSMCIGAKDLSSNSKQVSQPWEPISRLHFPAI